MQQTVGSCSDSFRQPSLVVLQIGLVLGGAAGTGGILLHVYF